MKTIISLFTRLFTGTGWSRVGTTAGRTSNHHQRASLRAQEKASSERSKAPRKRPGTKQLNGGDKERDKAKKVNHPTNERNA